MKIVCKNIRLYESGYPSLGGWWGYTYNLAFNFKFEDTIIERKIQWMAKDISFPKRYFSNEKKLISLMKKEIKLFFKEKAIDIKNKKHKDDLKDIMNNFSNKEEITIEL